MAPTPSPAPAFDLDAAWTVHPQVAVRPERFGALLYHFGTRRLSFLTDRALADVVTSLSAHPSARAALGATGVDTLNVDGPAARMTTALGVLAGTGMIVERSLP